MCQKAGGTATTIQSVTRVAPAGAWFCGRVAILAGQTRQGVTDQQDRSVGEFGVKVRGGKKDLRKEASVTDVKFDKEKERRWA
jgi:hypothetical protein